MTYYQANQINLRPRVRKRSSKTTRRKKMDGLRKCERRDACQHSRVAGEMEEGKRGQSEEMEKEKHKNLSCTRSLRGAFNVKKGGRGKEA